MLNEYKVTNRIVNKLQVAGGSNPTLATLYLRSAPEISQKEWYLKYTIIRVKLHNTNIASWVTLPE